MKNSILGHEPESNQCRAEARGIRLVSLLMAGVIVILIVKIVLDKKKNVSSKKFEEMRIQRQLLTQFAHEVRNKLTPAATTLEQILSSLNRPKSPQPTTTAGGSTSPKFQQSKTNTPRKSLSPTNHSGTSSWLVRLPESAQDEIKDSIALLIEAEALIKTRLALHRVAAGEYKSKLETRDLCKLMSRRAHLLSELAKVNVVFRSSVSESYRSKRIFAKLDVALWNYIADSLLYNSRKYTTKGAVDIIFVKYENNLLEFAVRDTGCGIPEPIAAMLFEEAVELGEDRGIGLGLVSSKRFANAVGGDVWLHETCVQAPDTPGSTEFRFTLPGTLVNLAMGQKSIDTDTFSPALFTSKKSIDESSEECMEERRQRRNTLENAIPTNLQVFVLDDSSVIRKSIVTKFKALARRIHGAFSFSEFDSVEAMLPYVSSLAALPNAVCTIDENLNSPNYTGSHLIRALVKAGFCGCIISSSGDPEIAKHHHDLGAALVWGKPLPSVDFMLHTLANFFLERPATTETSPKPHDADSTAASLPSPSDTKNMTECKSSSPPSPNDSSTVNS